MITRILILTNGLLLLLLYVKWESLTTSPNISRPTITAVNAPDMFCDGTLGENIFSDGDFGAGPLTNLPSDENGYAPGYQYENLPPPVDGFYTITNNTTNWGKFAATNWIDIQDNSPDPNGYMMVVNASYTPGIFYEKVIDGLCENTLYQFSADLINMMEPSARQITKPKIDFLIDGVVMYSTADIEARKNWETYGFTFKTDPGTSTLKLTMRNSAPGGIGNDLAIDNISFRTCGPNIEINTSNPFLCDGQTASLVATINGSQYETPFYQWQRSTDDGLTWTKIAGENDPELFLGIPDAGIAYRLLVSNNSATIDNSKCRVVSNVKTIEIEPKFFTHYDTLCEGLSLIVGDSAYNQSGVYTDSLIATYLCDSIVTTHLEIVADRQMTAEFDFRNPSCPGAVDGSIMVTNVINGSGVYLFALDSLPFQSSAEFTGLGQGSYRIFIEDSYGCMTDIIVNLNDPPFLTLSLRSDTAILLGQSITLNTQVNYPVNFIKWTPSEGLTCDDCLTPVARPFETTTYTITASNGGDCGATEEVTIIVDASRRVYFPNVFSPNFDGINDYFSVYGDDDIDRVLRLRVYDRWGALLFEETGLELNSEQAGWNGTFKNQEMNSGVYLYTAEVLFIDGNREIFSGDVTLLR